MYTMLSVHVLRSTFRKKNGGGNVKSMGHQLQMRLGQVHWSQALYTTAIRQTQWYFVAAGRNWIYPRDIWRWTEADQYWHGADHHPWHPLSWWAYHWTGCKHCYGSAVLLVQVNTLDRSNWMLYFNACNPTHLDHSMLFVVHGCFKEYVSMNECDRFDIALISDAWQVLLAIHCADSGVHS
jgi:hypothetical protein